MIARWALLLALVAGRAEAQSVDTVTACAKVCDTAIVNLAAPPPTVAGVPFGPSQMYAGCTLPDPKTFTLVKAGTTAANVGCTITLARAKRIALLVHPVAGRHALYLTNGSFDRSKWEAELATYGPAEIATVAQAYRDGLVKSLIVMDEPFNQGIGEGNAGNDWGDPPLTKALVDSLCADLKTRWPGIPVGAIHDADDFEPQNTYKVCDTRVAQYRWSKTRGDIGAFIAAELVMAQREQMRGIVFALNVIAGGRPGTVCESGQSFMPGKCTMSADNVKAWGGAMGPKGCALMEWKYDADYHGRPEIVAAHQWLGDSLRKVQGPVCGR